MVEVETDIVIWLNQWVSRSEVLDAIVTLIVSDYFVPVTLSLCLFVLWFATDHISDRNTTQKAVLRAMISIGFANLAVLIINENFFRERPFINHSLNLSLFYPPVDPSFPANPAALSFTIASAIRSTNQRVGWLMYALASAWCVSRIFVGVFYPSDILAGAIIGIIVSNVVGIGLQRIDPVTMLVLRTARKFHLA